MSSCSFPKNEHLKSKKQIQTLFHTGKAFSVFPLRVCYLLSPSDTSGKAQAGFSVPTRNFKKAVDRNRIKRRMREAYRLQKEDITALLHKNKLDLAVFFIYIDKDLRGSDLLHQKMKGALKQLTKIIQKELRENEKVQ